MAYYCIYDMLLCVRTTIEIDDHLLERAKRRALEQGTTLRAVVEAALREWLGRRELRRAPFKLKWTTVKGVPIPGVDFADRDALYERMEGRR